jgi:hypothetical protein
MQIHRRKSESIKPASCASELVGGAELLRIGMFVQAQIFLLTFQSDIDFTRD